MNIVRIHNTAKGNLIFRELITSYKDELVYLSAVKNNLDVASASL